MGMMDYKSSGNRGWIGASSLYGIFQWGESLRIAKNEACQTWQFCRGWFGRRGVWKDAKEKVGQRCRLTGGKGFDFLLSVMLPFLVSHPSIKWLGTTLGLWHVFLCIFVPYFSYRPDAICLIHVGDFTTVKQECSLFHGQWNISQELSLKATSLNELITTVIDVLSETPVEKGRAMFSLISR